MGSSAVWEYAVGIAITPSWFHPTSLFKNLRAVKASPNAIAVFA
jgi:hypothetical protein